MMGGGLECKPIKKQPSILMLPGNGKIFLFLTWLLPGVAWEQEVKKTSKKNKWTMKGKNEAN